MSEGIDEAKERAQEMKDKAIDHAHDTKEDAKEITQEVKDKAKDYAHDIQWRMPRKLQGQWLI